jgi:branched-chain amino acid transport system substrate-binding protein
MNSALVSGQEPFRIGALNPITGSGSAYGSGMQKAILFGAEEVNAAGGAGGRMLRVFAEDTQTQPEFAVLAAKKLVEVNKVEAILGTWSSGVTLAVMSAVTQPANVIQMCTSGADAITTADTKDLVWRFAPLSRTYGVIFAELAKELGFKRPAVMALNNASGLAQKEGFETTWKKLGGAVVRSLVYEPKRASYRSELQQVRVAKPDVIIAASYDTDMTILVREWFQTGIEVKFLAPSWGASKNMRDAVGPKACEGIYTVFGTSNLGSPACDHFDKKYREATGQPAESNKYAAMSYDMVNVLALAMEAAGPGADRLAINAKIREVANAPGAVVSTFAQGKVAMKKGKINYDGAGTRAEFDQNGDDDPDVFAVNIIRNGEEQFQKLIKKPNY